MIKLTEIEGILNYTGKSSDFFEEYEVLEDSKIFCNETDLNEYEFGIICSLKNIKDKVLKVNISERSYFNMKYFIDIHTKYVTPIYRLFTAVCNFSNVNIVAAIVHKYENGHYETLIIFEKDNEFLCVDCFFTDAICIMQSHNFPIYIHQKIVYSLGRDPKGVYEEIKNEKK